MTFVSLMTCAGRSAALPGTAEQRRLHAGADAAYGWKPNIDINPRFCVSGNLPE